MMNARRRFLLGSAGAFAATVQNLGVAIPALPATIYASDLSMHNAELWTSQPT